MLGSDFEIFVQDRSRHDPRAAISAAIFELPSKGQEPVPLHDDAGIAGYVHRDNLMLEFNAHPASTAEEWAANIERCANAGRRFVHDFNPAWDFSPLSHALFSASDTESEEGREIGCDADFISLDSNSTQRSPISAKTLAGIRYAGGHIHISYTRDMIPAWVGAMLCDLFIGIPEKQHLDRQRADTYGQISLHRPTTYPDGSHGVEYRPLDSYWARDTMSTMRIAKRAEIVQRLLEEAEVDLLTQLIRVHKESLGNLDLLCLTPDEVSIAMTATVNDLCKTFHFPVN